jgi:plastocyanin
MTLPLHICFSWGRPFKAAWGQPFKAAAGLLPGELTRSTTLLACALLLAAPLHPAALTGKVELRDSRDAAVRKKMDFSGVVIWLERVSGKAPDPPPAQARMIQKDKIFTPHILAIPVGATVVFPNFDPIFHNVFSNYDGQLFDLALYPPGASRSVTFKRPGVVRVFCNIHASMSAVIAVLDTPYFAISKKNGTFEIDGIAAGDYRLRLFHERATQVTLDALTRRLTIRGAEDLALPPLSISESGFLAIPHLNKFGRDYSPAPDDGGVYPAVRQ